MAYRIIDLFAGAGGFTLGFLQHANNKGQPLFKPVWANDFNKCAVETYKANFGDHCLGGDIVSILEDPVTKVPRADVVIGGPPCQGFSLLNKNRVADPRKQLWRPYMEVVNRSGASVFVMENVPELLKSFEFDDIVEEADRLGFKVAAAKLRVADYGVPQLRQRAFIIGTKFGNPKELFPPRKTHYNPDRPSTIDFTEYVDNPQPWRTVRHAIGDLEPPIGIEIRQINPPYNLHFGRTPTELSQKRYRAIPDEGMNRFDLLRLAPDLTPDCWVRKKKGGTDLFGRLWWNRPSFTIRTEFYKPEKGRYLHPEQHRPITHREAARFQSFPDNFIFCGSKIEVARQIGNAVPPLMGKCIAEVVLKMLRLRESSAKEPVAHKLELSHA